MSSPLQFHLEKYDGPLDLLLDLIRRHQIDIYDIPIASITAQYIEYMKKASELDIELGSEFVYMAATLIHLKSKTLLPTDPALIESSAEDDPRTELVNRLLEHEKYKEAAGMLQQKRLIEEAIWSNPQMRQFLAEDEHPGLQVSLFDLVQTLQTVLDRAKKRPTYDVDDDDVTVPGMVAYLRTLLDDAPGNYALSALELFEKQNSRRALLCLFLAILELVKRQALLLEQKDAFGDIALRRGEMYDLVLEGEPVLASVEEEYR